MPSEANWYSPEQFQRVSNPCLHLERVERIVARRPGRSHGVPFLQIKMADFDDRWNALTRPATPWNGVVG